MKLYRPFFVVLLLACFTAAAPVKAAVSVMFDQGTPNLGDGSWEITHWKAANRFTLNAASVLTNVKFWDLEASPDFQNLILWEIRASTGSNLPGAVLFSGTSSNLTHATTPRNASPYVEYVIAFDIGAISLPAGSYFLVLHNGPLSFTVFDNDTHKGIYWESANTNRSDPSYSDEAPFTDSWGGNDLPQDLGYPPGNSQLAFQLNGVPETYRAKITAIGFASNGAPRVSFTTFNGQHYRVDYKNRLTDASWTTVTGATNVSGTGSVVTVTDPGPSIGSTRVYRVVLLL